MIVLRPIVSITLTALLLIPVIAQQRDQKPAKSSKSRPAAAGEAEELRLSAISLLHSLAQSANEMGNVAERVRVLAEIGDAFWLVDPEQGRALLVRSFKEIDKLAARSQANPEMLASQKRSLRRVVLSRIVKHEPSLANDLIHSLADEIPTADEKAMQRQGVPTPNADALLAAADNLLASDPKQAAAVAAYSLKDGLSQRLRLFLIKLRAKDSVAADGLVRAAVHEASAQHPGRLFDVMVLWDYVYQPQDFFFNGIVWRREKNENRQDVSRDLRRLVLAFAVNAIVENLQQIPAGADAAQDRNLAHAQLASLHSVIQQLLPSMQADWPRGTTDLQQALFRADQELRTSGLPPPSRPPIEDPNAPITAIDSLIEKAAAAPQGDARDALYLDTSLKLLELRQYERAKEIASRIDDLERRAMILEPLNFRLANQLVEQANLDEALTIASQLKAPELRIAALARIGKAHIEAGDSRTGVQTLNTAQAAASKADPTLELSAAALRVAAALSKEDPIRTAELITLAIQIVNKVKPDDSPWVLLAAADVDDALHLSWKNEEGGGLKWVKSVLPRNGGLVNLLAKQEFNQAISLAKAINNKALSLAAQAAICRAAIESTKNKAITAKPNEGN